LASKRTVALEIAAFVQSRFVLTLIARALRGFETRHAYARRARNAPSLRRDFLLTPIGPVRFGPTTLTPH